MCRLCSYEFLLPTTHYSLATILIKGGTIMTHVTIIGGGIAGLATAFYLQCEARDAGIQLDYTLIEAGSRFGGKIITETEDEFVIEGGPDSFITQKPWATQLCRDLGLLDRLLPTNDERRNVFVLQDDELVPFPGGFRLTIPTEFVPFAKSPLISMWGKLRMGLDLIRPARQEQGDESLASFFGRRLGQEAVDKIAGPMMAGIYMADPERLSIQSTFPMFTQMEQKYGSLIRAMQSSKANAKQRSDQNSKPLSMFTSLQGGMNELVETLVSKLKGDLRVNCQIAEIKRNASGFEVIFEDETRSPLYTDAVILAVPAYSAANLLRSVDLDLVEKLREIRYASTATVSLGYEQADLPDDLDGFGFMIPRAENPQISACTWSSIKFDHRAPEAGLLLRLFIGGDGRSHFVDRCDDALISTARQTVRELMGITAEPTISKVFRWPNGSPQYDVGHLDRVAEIEQLTATIPGLYLTGSAYRGIGIPDCVKQARQVVGQVIDQVNYQAGIAVKISEPLVATAL